MSSVVAPPGVFLTYAAGLFTLQNLKDEGFASEEWRGEGCKGDTSHSSLSFTCNNFYEAWKSDLTFLIQK